MSEIKYRISSVTSQHPKYPASNLVESNNKNGWQSQVNCSYPQSLTIQFYVPIRTKKLQIMFHQYKIPQLVDVFVKLGARQSYRKLGFVVPTDNSQSSYEQKEEKTLYFQFSCTHIRLVFHQNYKCDMNIFNQVAIQDLIVIGQILTHKEIQGVDLQQEQSSEDQVSQSLQILHNQRTYESNNRNNQQDKNYMQPKHSQTTALFKDIYAKVQTQKQAAVAKQEYQRASHLKNILNNFKHLQNEINKLQREKSEALKNQDYDKCYRLKTEINKKKQIVQFQREELMKNQEQFYLYNTYSSRTLQKENTGSNQSKKKQPVSKDINQFKSPQVQRKIHPANPSIYLHDQQVLPAILNKGKNIQNLPLETNQKRKQTFIQFSQSAIPDKRTESDNASIKKDINQIRQPIERAVETSIVNQSFIADLEPLETKLRMRIQNYFNFIPEIYWQLCQHKNWKGKLEALKFVKTKVEEVQTKQQFMAIFQIISRIITSKQATISIQSLQILLKLTQLNIHFSLQHLPFFVEEIINQLLNFFNDTNKNIKELALKTYLNFPKISFLNISILIRQLIKHKNKVKNDPKLVITKLQVMTKLIQTYRQSQYNFKQIINWILQYLQDPNQKVRQEAGNLLIALAYLLGSERIIKAIEAINKPGLFQLVLNYMNNSSFQHSKANIDQSKLSLQNSKLQNEFYGPEIAIKLDSKQSLGKNQSHNVMSTDRKQRMQHSKNSRKQSENMNVDLSYSRQSAFQQSLQHPGSKVSQHHYGQGLNQIKVLEQQPQQQEEVCLYCQQKYTNQKQHYIHECKVLPFCQKCGAIIYIREFTQHLLKECQNSHLHRQCKKCGLAFDIEQINQHIGKDTCKKKLGINWQRCQFCGSDILAEDKFWTQHAIICPGLPDKKDATNRLYQEDQEHQSFYQ